LRTVSAFRSSELPLWSMSGERDRLDRTITLDGELSQEKRD